jgi:metal-dependent amidase/aminoacylase/carboxypeptidase family protein
MLQVPNGSINVVPGRCKFSLDLRAPNDPQRDALAADVLAELKAICERRGLRYTLEESMRASAAPSAPAWQQRWEARRRCAGRAAVPHAQRRRPRRDEAARGDAAGHALRARQNSGISHNPLESAPTTTCSWRWTPSSLAGQPAAEQLAGTKTEDNHDDYDKLDAWIDAHFDEEVRFLQELVRVPTDTPPGNNAPHAERTAELLKDFGFAAEKHAVPRQEVKATACNRSPT